MRVLGAMLGWQTYPAYGRHAYIVQESVGAYLAILAIAIFPLLLRPFHRYHSTASRGRIPRSRCPFWGIDPDDNVIGGDS